VVQSWGVYSAKALEIGHQASTDHAAAQAKFDRDLNALGPALSDRWKPR
jgi:hypothetical protein